MLMAQPQFKVAVLGAGIVGLSTAVCIQESFPDCHVTIVSELFSPDTTSDGSGGVWLPFHLKDTDPILVTETGKATYNWLKQLCLSPLAGEVGAQLATIYCLEEVVYQGEKEEDYKHYVDGYRRLTQTELKSFNGAGSGISFETIIIDVTSYLRWLMLRFKSNGGVVTCKKIDSLAQIGGQWRFVVNCCGIGAASLFKDNQLQPIRGQIIQMDAPWIKHCYFFKPQNGKPYTYLIPGVNTVAVGGTAGMGDWNTRVSGEDDEDIWDRAVRIFPQISGARKVKSWAGLRPSRSSMRLETENVNIGGLDMKVIHNYGHGGSGVTLHWGCAQKVVSMLSGLLPHQHNTMMRPKFPVKPKL